MNVRQNAAIGQTDAGEELIQFLVVSNGELKVTRYDAHFLVVARRVAGEFEHFGGEIFEHGGEIDGRAGADSFGVVAATKHSMESTNGKLKSGARRARLRLCASFSAFATTRHSFFYSTISEYDVLGDSFVNEIATRFVI